jgi:hypothetical protein
VNILLRKPTSGIAATVMKHTNHKEADMAFTKRWSHLRTEQQLEELRVEFDAALKKIKGLEKRQDETDQRIKQINTQKKA